MGKSTISMAIFNCYVSSPEGKSVAGLFIPGVPWQKSVSQNQDPPPLKSTEYAAEVTTGSCFSMGQTGNGGV